MASQRQPTPNPEKGEYVYDIEGTRWTFHARLMDMGSTKREPLDFANEYIELFEYDNQINNFLLTGQIIYRDTSGKLGQYFRLQHLMVNVWWSEQPVKYVDPLKDDHEGTTTGAKIVTPLAASDQFYHLFLVNKIEIIRHEMPSDVLVYRLELISAYWYQFSAICHWSNYADKEPWPITKIICDILIKTVGKDMVDVDSFINDHNRTELKIFYITTEQDNAITAINYLLNRLYLEPASFDTDNHPRVIVFDEWINKWRMVNLNNSKTFLKVKSPNIQLDRFWDVSDKEISVFEDPRERGEKYQVTSVSKIGYTKNVEDFYTRSYWDINIVKDKFVRKYIESDKIVNLFLKTIQDDKYEFRPATFNIVEQQAPHVFRPDLQALLQGYLRAAEDEPGQPPAGAGVLREERRAADEEGERRLRQDNGPEGNRRGDGNPAEVRPDVGPSAVRILVLHQGEAHRPLLRHAQRGIAGDSEVHGNPLHDEIQQHHAIGGLEWETKPY